MCALPFVERIMWLSMANRGCHPLAIDLPPEEVPNERTKKKKDTPPRPADVKLTLKIKFLFDCVEVGGVVVLAPTKARACMTRTRPGPLCRRCPFPPLCTTLIQVGSSLRTNNAPPIDRSCLLSLL